jgi:hypothetical protein
MPEKEATLYLRDIPVDVKLHFKSWCAKRGLTMRQAILDFMNGKKEAITKCKNSQTY